MPDNAFIWVERFQVTAGGGDKAEATPHYASADGGTGDGRNSPEGGTTLMQFREWQMKRDIDRNLTSWCPEIPRMIHYSCYADMCLFGEALSNAVK